MGLAPGSDPKAQGLLSTPRQGTGEEIMAQGDPGAVTIWDCVCTTDSSLFSKPFLSFPGEQPSLRGHG